MGIVSFPGRNHLVARLFRARIAPGSKGMSEPHIGMTSLDRSSEE